MKKKTTKKKTVVKKKTAVKKKTVKKVATKKKTTTKKKNVNPDNYFYVCDGNVVKDLRELKRALKDMEHNVYCHHVHVREGKPWNDFSNWVRDVLKDKKLANSILKANDTKSMLKRL